MRRLAAETRRKPNLAILLVVVRVIVSLGVIRSTTSAASPVC